MAQLKHFPGKGQSGSSERPVGGRPRPNGRSRRAKDRSSPGESARSEHSDEEVDSTPKASPKKRQGTTAAASKGRRQTRNQVQAKNPGPSASAGKAGQLDQTTGTSASKTTPTKPTRGRPRGSGRGRGQSRGKAQAPRNTRSAAINTIVPVVHQNKDSEDTEESDEFVDAPEVQQEKASEATGDHIFVRDDESEAQSEQSSTDTQQQEGIQIPESNLKVGNIDETKTLLLQGYAGRDPLVASAYGAWEKVYDTLVAAGKSQPSMSQPATCLEWKPTEAAIAAVYDALNVFQRAAEEFFDYADQHLLTIETAMESLKAAALGVRKTGKTRQEWYLVRCDYYSTIITQFILLCDRTLKTLGIHYTKTDVDDYPIDTFESLKLTAKLMNIIVMTTEIQTIRPEDDGRSIPISGPMRSGFKPNMDRLLKAFRKEVNMRKYDIDANDQALKYQNELRARRERLEMEQGRMREEQRRLDEISNRRRMMEEHMRLIDAENQIEERKRAYSAMADVDAEPAASERQAQRPRNRNRRIEEYYGTQTHEGDQDESPSSESSADPADRDDGRRPLSQISPRPPNTYVNTGQNQLQQRAREQKRRQQLEVPDWDDEEDDQLIELLSLYKDMPLKERYIACLNGDRLQNRLPEQIQSRAIYLKPFIVDWYKTQHEGEPEEQVVPPWVTSIDAASDLRT